MIHAGCTVFTIIPYPEGNAMRAKDHLESLLKQIVADKGYEWPEKANVEPPRDKSHGDLATNVAMMLTKQAKANPRQIAEEIKAELEKACDTLTAEIAGPGFLNVTFAPSWWQRLPVAVLKAAEDYGRSDLGSGRKVQIEYVSANPTGPLHIGHGRGAAVGDSLARILRATGHDVTTEYYINDAGRQMRLLGNSVWVRLQQSQGRDIELPEDSYKGEYIKDIAAAVFAKHPGILEMAEEEALAICQDYALRDILAGIKTDLETFGVEHQVWFSEKTLVDAGKVDATLQRLKDEGKAFDEGGALWYRTTEYGDDKDRVLKKSDGYLTYFASDIAYHDDKYQRGFDLVVDIWGADHHGYVPRMKAAVQGLGKEREQLQCILVQLVNLLQGGEQVAMSTRAGKFETLADVCADVGSDAARFIFLSRKSDSHLDFDLDLVKQKSMDNPVYYVQYAHARICSVMKKAAEQGVTIPDAASATAEILAKLNTEEDMLLLKLLDRWCDVLPQAAHTLSPHTISYFLMDLAGALHRYYTVNHVLTAEDTDTVQARLLILSAVAQVIRNGLELLGVSAPESM